jgi:hypothetical protein
MPPEDNDFLQTAKDFTRHPFGQIHETVVASNLDAADVSRIQPRFVGNRSNNIPGLNTMFVSDFNSECFHSDFVRLSGAAFTWRTLAFTSESIRAGMFRLSDRR